MVQQQLSNVIDLFRARPAFRDWSNDELASFYRVEGVLVQSGLAIDSARGMTDEGDPWFVFCRRDTAEVFLHFARLDGGYIAASPAMNGSVWRRRFPELLKALEEENPLLLPQAHKRSSELFIHPATLLIAAVATFFYKSSPAKADEVGDEQARAAEARASAGPMTLSESQAVTLLSALTLAVLLEQDSFIFDGDGNLATANARQDLDVAQRASRAEFVSESPGERDHASQQPSLGEASEQIEFAQASNIAEASRLAAVVGKMKTLEAGKADPVVAQAAAEAEVQAAEEPAPTIEAPEQQLAAPGESAAPAPEEGGNLEQTEAAKSSGMILAETSIAVDMAVVSSVIVAAESEEPVQLTPVEAAPPPSDVFWAVVDLEALPEPPDTVAEAPLEPAPVDEPAPEIRVPEFDRIYVSSMAVLVSARHAGQVQVIPDSTIDFVGLAPSQSWGSADLAVA